MKAPFCILAAEDDEQDVELLRLALADPGAKAPPPEAAAPPREAGAPPRSVRLEVVGDGAAALAYLRGEGPYAGKPRPDLMLLDLNMPGMDGRRFLAERRADPALRAVPVVVLTTSLSARDVGDCYALGANCFVAKPVGFEKYRSVLASVARFWSAVAKLPERAGD